MPPPYPLVKVGIVKLSIVLLGIVLYISPARGAGGGCILCRGCLHVVQGVGAYYAGGNNKSDFTILNKN